MAIMAMATAATRLPRDFGRVSGQLTSYLTAWPVNRTPATEGQGDGLDWTGLGCACMRVYICVHKCCMACHHTIWNAFLITQMVGMYIKAVYAIGACVTIKLL